MSKKKSKFAKRFDIRKMPTSAKYCFIGVGVIFIVLVCFFVGLAIDFLLKQPAIVAIWGIWLGAMLSLVFCWLQLRKLVDR